MANDSSLKFDITMTGYRDEDGKYNLLSYDVNIPKDLEDLEDQINLHLVKIIRYKDDLSDRYVRAGGREKKKDFKGAIEDINVILQHDSNNSGLIFKRGLNKFKVSDFKGAIADFSEVLKSDPTDKYSFYYKGIANLRLSNFRNAINDFTSAVTMGISEKELYFHRGLAEMEVDKYNVKRRS